MPRRNRRKHSKSEGTLGFNPYKYITRRSYAAGNTAGTGVRVPASEDKTLGDSNERMVRRVVYSERSSLDRQHRHKARKLTLRELRTIRFLAAGLSATMDWACGSTKGRPVEVTHTYGTTNKE